MICTDCGKRNHPGCRGGTWCDCQHQPPTHARADGDLERATANELTRMGQELKPEV